MDSLNWRAISKQSHFYFYFYFYFYANKIAKICKKAKTGSEKGAVNT
jgi:hypothetical protein